MGNPTSRPMTYANQPSVVFLPDIIPPTGNPGVGFETHRRQPPAYPVIGGMKSVRLAPLKIGLTEAFRNDLASATAQAINAFNRGTNTTPKGRNG